MPIPTIRCTEIIPITSWCYITWVLLILSVLPRPLHAELIFSNRPLGPAANIIQINEQGESKALTNDTTWRDVQGSLSAAGELLFLSNRRDNKTITLKKHRETVNLFVKKPGADTQPKTITHDDNAKRQPVFSPDGKWITYISSSHKKEELIAIHRQTHQIHRLVQKKAIYDYSWSQDNARLVYAAGDPAQSELSIVTLKDGAIRTLIKSPSPNRIVSAQWSNSSEHIAFITAHNQPNTRILSLYDVATRRSSQLSGHNQQVQSPVSWSKDSRHILYSALTDFRFTWNEKKQQKEYQGGMHIFLTDLKGQNQQLTQGNHLHNRPVFSPDQKRIAFLFFETFEDTDATLKTMNLEGKENRILFAPVLGSSSLHWY